MILVATDLELHEEATYNLPKIQILACIFFKLKNAFEGIIPCIFFKLKNAFEGINPW